MRKDDTGVTGVTGVTKLNPIFNQVLSNKEIPFYTTVIPKSIRNTLIPQEIKKSVPQKTILNKILYNQVAKKTGTRSVVLRSGSDQSKVYKVPFNTHIVTNTTTGDRFSVPLNYSDI